MNLLKRVADRAIRVYGFLRPQFRADGLAVAGRNLSFLDELATAWRAVEKANPSFLLDVPDIRWRAHIALWAARHAMHLEGDLVECGVFCGILATVICNSIPDFGSKRYWLFDTYEGVPVETVEGEERRNAEGLNANFYSRVDAERVVRDAVGRFAYVRIVKGILPASLQTANIEKVAYLSVDLNNTPAEMGVAESLWDRLVPGAIVVLDDYGFSGHRGQHDAWDAFCAARGVAVVTLPTGQGLIVKPPGSGVRMAS